jgi:outer membrane protein insertion porin family
MRSRKLNCIVAALFLVLGTISLRAQEPQEIYDFMNESDYIVGGVSISGVRYLDVNALIGISGLRVGQEITIPGEAVTKAVQRLVQQGLFSDVRMSISSVKSDTVYLDIYLQERARISAVKLNGIRKSETQDITDKIKLPIGSQITSYILSNTQKTIRDHYVEKGFLNTTVEFVQKDDPDQPNNVILYVNVKRRR